MMLIMSNMSIYAQSCKFNVIKSTTPNNRFELMGKGAEVKDTITGLIWQRCSVGQTWDGNTCTGTATQHTWQQALTVAKNLENNYRLPNIKELKSIVERQCYNPAINSQIFPNTPSGYYWSSSPYIYTNNSSSYIDIFVVKFEGGDDANNNKNKPVYVRAVRSE